MNGFDWPALAIGVVATFIAGFLVWISRASILSSKAWVLRHIYIKKIVIPSFIVPDNYAYHTDSLYIDMP